MAPIKHRVRSSRAAPSKWGDRRTTRIGLLGGSFNPAHDGHVHISRVALARLNLDAVWWLVSPGNPLKSPQEMAPLRARLKAAQTVVGRDPRLVPLSLETDWGTVKTADTLRMMRTRFPRARFVWIMGADNLVQLPFWDRWLSIMHTMPLAIMDRAPFSFSRVHGRAPLRFASSRCTIRGAKTLADQRPPAWLFMPIRTHKASATSLRAGRGAAWATLDLTPTP